MSAKKAGGRPPKSNHPQADYRDPPFRAYPPKEWPSEKWEGYRAYYKAATGGILPENPDDLLELTPEIRDLIARNNTLGSLLVDPSSQEPLARTFAPFIVGIFTSDNERLLVERATGELLARALRILPSDELGEFFKMLCRLKKNLEAPRRNLFAFLAYAMFSDENGREPSKPELKAYILQHKDIYRDKPDAGDGKGWTRVWKQSGLFNLSEKVGTKNSHGATFASSAYDRFIKEWGRKPTKTDLKRFILARPNIYKQAPAGGNRKAWAALWEQSGLFAPPEG